MKSAIAIAAHPDDIEFFMSGTLMRLRAAGYEIRQVPTLQVTHLKRWTARNLLITDFRDRALPWSWLILETGNMIDDLNVETSQRISALSVLVGLAAIPTGFWFPASWLILALVIPLLLVLNRRFYRFLHRQRGLWFVLRALPWHWFYYLYSSIAFGLSLIAYHLSRWQKSKASPEYDGA